MYCRTCGSKAEPAILSHSRFFLPISDSLCFLLIIIFCFPFFFNSPVPLPKRQSFQLLLSSVVVFNCQLMDPCQFVRVSVGNLALKIPVASRPARSGVHPSMTPCYCRIRFDDLPCRTVTLPLITPENVFPPTDQPLTVAATFDLSKSDLEKLGMRSIFRGSGSCALKVAIYTGRRGSTCGLSTGRLLGKVRVPIELKGSTDRRPCVFHNGWVSVGKGGNKGVGTTQVHLTVVSESDPRFVFEFDGEPECSPQVFQVEGGRRQPVFSCKFSCRNPIDRNNRSLSMQSETSSSRSWLGSFGSERERVVVKERKGWSVTVHDLSGSPVALASMVTPFVASPGSNRVSRSNPGAWLILRPGNGTWKPWGRLEAWRERGGSSDGLGYSFQLLPDTNMGGSDVLLAESALSTNKGGKFTIDLPNNFSRGGNVGHRHGRRRSTSSSSSPSCSPHGSGDFGYGFWPFSSYRGFVMSSTVGSEGKCSKPVVEIGIQNVGCSEDAAAFVALAAAIDLSMNACKLFSNKILEKLSQHHDHLV